LFKSFRATMSSVCATHLVIHMRMRMDEDVPSESAPAELTNRLSSVTHKAHTALMFPTEVPVGASARTCLPWPQSDSVAPPHGKFSDEALARLARDTSRVSLTPWAIHR